MKNRFLFLATIFILLLFSGCKNSKTLPVLIEFQPPQIVDYDNYLTDSSLLVMFVDSTKIYLKRNRVPSFLLNECLDIEYDQFSIANKYVSIRYTLFQNLNLKEIKKLLKLSKKYDLIKECSKESSFLFYHVDNNSFQFKNSEKSTLQLLKERFLELEKR